jgi:DNA replication protein DnaC
MYTHTLQQLASLRLAGMARSFETRINQPDHQDLSHEEFVGLLVDDEYIHRQNARQTRLLHTAKLKLSAACFEEIDYTHSRGLQKSVITALQNTAWITEHQNILISGATGVGKSYLACAFGQWACRNGFTVSYSRWPRMLGDMLASRGEGQYLKHLQRLAKVHVLIIDDFGITPLTDSDKKDLLEIIEDRYLTGATIMTSQLPLKDWHESIGDPTIADAVCDRLFHHAYTFELKGGSMRKKQHKNDVSVD